MEMLKPAQTRILMDAIGFNEAELEANAHGQLTDAQKMYLSSKRRRWLLGFFVSALLAIGMALYVIGRIATQTFLKSRFDVPMLIGVPAMVSFSHLAFKQWRGYTQSLYVAVESVEGPIYLTIEGKRSSSKRHYVVIGDSRFSVKPDVFVAFRNGDPYRIYYSPSSNTILSSEWLQPE